MWLPAGAVLRQACAASGANLAGRLPHEIFTINAGGSRQVMEDVLGYDAAVTLIQERRLMGPAIPGMQASSPCKGGMGCGIRRPKAQAAVAPEALPSTGRTRHRNTGCPPLSFLSAAWLDGHPKAAEEHR